MATVKQVGFSRFIHLPWLEYVAQLTLAGKTREDIAVELAELLATKLLGGKNVQRGSLDKTISVLLKIWFCPPKRLQHCRDEGLELLAQNPARLHLPLHWGMSMAAYPFFGQVASVIGRLLRLQERIGTEQVQRRIREQLGDRETISRSARHVYRTFIDWQVLTETGAKGVYQKAAPTIITDPRLAAWLLECVLHTNGSGWISASSLDGHASLFPFVVGATSKEALFGRPSVEAMRHGLNQEMVRLRVGETP